MVDGHDALVQDTKSRLAMTVNEYPFNTRAGIDYLDYLSRNDTRGLLAAIEARVTDDSRVVSCVMSVSKSSGALIIMLIDTEHQEVRVDLD